ncbi:nucleoid-associated protein [Enterococcus sp. AZ126]|uniref:nucleoid-associated protein n=1 Tax=Enterococcus sp. AZ126 TaxID=2774635 RepID=UPI003F1FF88C
MTVSISKIIAHKLNLEKNGGDRAILADSLIQFENEQEGLEAFDFFTTHIEQSREQGFVKKCQFWDLEGNTIKSNVERIYAHLEDVDNIDQVIVDESKKMALKLRKIMMGTSSRSDGSLFVLLYSIDGNNHIGILKMDPDTGVEVRDDLTIKVRNEMLPSKREKLHKAALILCKNEYIENDLHLFALDRQKSSNEPAKYFMEEFLNVKILPDDRNLTVEYQKEMVSVFKDVLPKEIFMEFNQRFKQRLLTGEYFTLENDFDSLVRDLLPEESRDADLSEYKRMVQRTLVRKYPGEVTGFSPAVEKINPTIFQSIDKSIEIKILPDADDGLYDKNYQDDGTFVLTIYPEAGLEEKK